MEKLRSVFRENPAVGLVYFFGSRAEGRDGPLSDYDFAVYFGGRDEKKMFKMKCELAERISRLLKTEEIDVVVLNTAKNSELKYQIVNEGRIIFEREPFKVIVEPRILNEYFDFRAMLRRYGLTRA